MWNSFNLRKLVEGFSVDVCVSFVCREVADIDQIPRSPESSGPPPVTEIRKLVPSRTALVDANHTN